MRAVFPCPEGQEWPRLRCLGGIIALAAMSYALSFGHSSAQVQPHWHAVVIAEEPGQWLTRSQIVFDTTSHTIVRRLLKIWDTVPSRQLEFTWVSNESGSGAEGPIRGFGRLIRRRRNIPGYAANSIVSQYEGSMRNGRPNGAGTYRETEGLSFTGHWTSGVIQGFGRLHFADGSEFAGPFRDGRANGVGTFVDVDGEVYDGPFKNGLREGKGLTRLPNGLDYSSTWSEGKELAASMRLRIAQNGDKLDFPVDDVRVGINVEQKSADDDRKLGYTANTSSDSISVMPDDPRLMGAWKGDADIQLTPREHFGTENGSFGIFARDPRDRVPLRFLVQVQNRGERQIQISGLTVDVAESVTDLQPAVQVDNTFHEDAPHSRLGFDSVLEIQNFGWGQLQDASIDVLLGAPQLPGAVPRTRALDTVSKVLAVDFERDLADYGVDVTLFKTYAGKRIHCATNPICKTMISSSLGTLAGKVSLKMNGPYADVSVPVLGKLRYAWFDGNGVKQVRTSPFKAKLPLANFFLAPGPELVAREGGEAEVLKEGAAEPLKLNTSNYQLPIAFERSIPAGQIARYELALKAQESSTHHFRVVVQLADGRRIRSRLIEMLYFVPSWLPPG